MNAATYPDTFSTLKECADFALTNKDRYEESAYEALYYYSNADEKNPFMATISFLEEKFRCSGLCEPDMFFATLDVGEGMP
jgi:hypothetical protein